MSLNIYHSQSFPNALPGAPKEVLSHMAKEPRCEVPLPLSTNWLQSMNGKYAVLMNPGSFLVAPSPPGTRPFLSVFFPSCGLGEDGPVRHLYSDTQILVTGVI